MDGPYYLGVEKKKDYQRLPKAAQLASEKGKAAGEDITDGLTFTRIGSGHSNASDLAPISPVTTHGREHPPYVDDRTPRDRITESEIRLLRLRPGNKDDDLRGNIERYTFRHDPNVDRTGTKKRHGAFDVQDAAEADDLPPYEALSYTWGEDKIVGTIKILEGGKMYEIGLRRNLMAALKMLRHPPRVRESRAEIQVLRDQARADPKWQFRRLQKKIQEGDRNGALRDLRVMLPEISDDGHRNYIDEALQCEYHSPEEDRAIREFKEMVSKEWYDDESRHRYLWIDSICIDQLDKEEKSRQIPRMSDIYMKAKEVCVWLGEEQSETRSHIAMDFVPEVLKNWEDIGKILDPSMETQWDAFITLIRRPWFSRRWIVQELTRAKKATIYCGTRRVRWEQFADVISVFKQYQLTIQDLFKRSVQLDNDPDRIGDLDELSAIRLVHASDHLFRRTKGERICERLLPLEGLMSTLTAFEASEPKDTIYAIVWLARDATPVSKRTFEMEAKPDGHIPSLERKTSTKSQHLPSRRSSVAGLPVSRNEQRPTLEPKTPPDHPESQQGKTTQGDVPRSDRQDPEQPIPAGGGEAAAASVNGEGSVKDTDAQLLDLEEFRGTLLNRMLEAEKRKISLNDFWIHEKRKWGRVFRTKLSQKRFLIDYEKSLFEVCYDFLRFSIDRSGRLDMLCRPWAPDPSNEDLRNEGQLPSWVRRLSENQIFSKHPGGPMERINADPLVGRPGTGEKPFYSADRGIRATFKTCWIEPAERARDPQDWMNARVDRENKDEVKRVLREKRCLIVRGFVLDQVRHRYPAARGGRIPIEWLKAIDWMDPNAREPPDIFWRTLVGNRDQNGDRAPLLWKRACQQEFKKRVSGGDLSIKGLLLKSNLSQPTRLFLKRVESVIYRRSLLELKYHDLAVTNDTELAKEKKNAGDIESVQKGDAHPNGAVDVPPTSSSADISSKSTESTPKRQRPRQVSSASPPPLSKKQTFFKPQTKEEYEAASDNDVERRGLALGPCETQEGDIIAIIFGCSVPVVLRKVVENQSSGAAQWSWNSAKYDYELPRRLPRVPENETPQQVLARMTRMESQNEQDRQKHELERFQIIGECYVHEKMDGEAWTIPNIYQEIRRFSVGAVYRVVRDGDNCRGR
ncbi:hypothetical protein GQ53DRAFT_876326 [Thozetella sp. PMI_491]|nr:hypothetical protein GQ53DRAFT_876326 [Thozetella sp. PMI_491]